MNGFFLIVAQNIVAAFILALLVGGLTRLVRSPPLAHMLWLLVLRSLSLKERIEMILESQFQPRVSPRLMLLISVIAVFVLPTFVRFTRREAAAQDEKPPVVAQPEAAGSQFPYTVKFEQGATKFFKGDKITILEVRGTAETFTPGDIYWIKGTYTLASHEAATLAAYTTAKHAADARSKSYTAQTMKIEKGDGTFALFLPMACEGWPHVSFYSTDDGEGFGGNYFGTGESVLKHFTGGSLRRGGRQLNEPGKLATLDSLLCFTAREGGQNLATHRIMLAPVPRQLVCHSINSLSVCQNEFSSRSTNDQRPSADTRRANCQVVRSLRTRILDFEEVLRSTRPIPPTTNRALGRTLTESPPGVVISIAGAS
ncbi:MAG TPA: hypothetical protein VF278_15525 [Pirellulales bacterium]